MTSAFLSLQAHFYSPAYRAVPSQMFRSSNFVISTKLMIKPICLAISFPCIKYIDMLNNYIYTALNKSKIPHNKIQMSMYIGMAFPQYNP